MMDIFDNLGISLSLSLFRFVEKFNKTKNFSVASVDALKYLTKTARKYEIKVLELGFPPWVDVKDLHSEVWEEVRKIICDFDKVTCHAPMLNLATWKKRIRDKNVRKLIELIERAFSNGINQFVLHLAEHERFEKEVDNKLIKEVAERSFDEIMDYFKKEKNLIIGLENLTEREPAFQNPNEFKSLFKGNVGLVIDTVHATSCRLNPVELIRFYKNNLIEVHLTDGKPPRKSGMVVKHLALGRGNVPLREVIQKLKEIKFKGPIIIEVDSKRDLIESMNFLNRL